MWLYFAGFFSLYVWWDRQKILESEQMTMTYRTPFNIIYILMFKGIFWLWPRREKQYYQIYKNTQNDIAFISLFFYVGKMGAVVCKYSGIRITKFTCSLSRCPVMVRYSSLELNTEPKVVIQAINHATYQWTPYDLNNKLFVRYSSKPWPE